MRWRKAAGSSGVAIVAVTVCVASDAAPERDDAKVILRGLPSSGRRFWQRVRNPSGEKVARVKVLVERLMMKAEAARREPDLAKRLFASVMAIVELSRVAPKGAGELGFFVGHALVGSEHPDDGTARAWLSAAIVECPASPLVFEAWLDLAQLCARRDDIAGELNAIEQAGRLTSTPGDSMRLHLAWGMSYERVGKLEQARLEYVAWSRLDVDENGLAQAGWHLAVVLDIQGEHLAALGIIDEAEARAYDRDPNQLVAIDSQDTRWATNLYGTYAEGVKYRWLAERRLLPPPFESQRKALAAFEAVARSAEAGRWGMAKWHILELKRAMLKH